ncbi:hypothetical protein [Sulfitobacter sp. HGT1]|uniref:hypothetical protein n=1 Tax=Sulfitobacter sp. HGT1 TaxID=2735435 RepID=UPI001593AED9|nr:hypothetical protein [Sulfitobacter sp. HGT1]
MDYLRNHCWCHSAHWDSKPFDCQIIVSLYSYREGYKEDWENLTVESKYHHETYANEWVESMKAVWKEHGREKPPEEIEDYRQRVGNRTIRELKPEVLEWLAENVPDVAEGKGWCVGDKSYNAGGITSSYAVFFQRRRDAMAFIKRWSVHQKPINYCQYFTDVRKKLNLETGKYES